MNPLATNPFTILTLIAAPAVLTNASSVLALGTSNRFARAIDRARALSKQLEEQEANDGPMTRLRVRQLNRTERRSILLLQALRCFYTSLGSFAAAALISLIGAALAASTHQLFFHITLWLALMTGMVGVGGLVFGCTLLVTETRMAVLNVTEEAALVRERYAKYLDTTKGTEADPQ